MPKAAAGAGGLFAEMAKHAEKAPGPGHYSRETSDRNFLKEARGGTFSKLTRDMNKMADKTPAVGQYQVTSSQTTRRIRGGLMAKTDRKCAFAKIAEKLNEMNGNGPGKYDPHVPEKHQQCPNFQSGSSESRNGKKITSVGPGYYNPTYDLVEHSVPCYSSSREDTSSFLNRLQKDKDKNPFPCYKDMPDSKVHDKIGKRHHCDRLIKDRNVPPRIASRRRETKIVTPRASTAPHSSRGPGTALGSLFDTPRAPSAPGSARGGVRSARETPVGRETPVAMSEAAFTQTASQAHDI